MQLVTNLCCKALSRKVLTHLRGYLFTEVGCPELEVNLITHELVTRCKEHIYINCDHICGSCGTQLSTLLITECHNSDTHGHSSLTNNIHNSVCNIFLYDLNLYCVNSYKLYNSDKLQPHSAKLGNWQENVCRQKRQLHQNQLRVFSRKFSISSL